MVPPPGAGAGADTTFLTGIARNGDRLVSLPNIDRLAGTTAGAPALTI